MKKANAECLQLVREAIAKYTHYNVTAHQKEDTENQNFSGNPIWIQSKFSNPSSTKSQKTGKLIMKKLSL